MLFWLLCIMLPFHGELKFLNVSQRTLCVYMLQRAVLFEQFANIT